MAVRDLRCPSCGSSLTEFVKANQVIRCPVCASTLLVSDWIIGDTDDTVVVATPTRAYTVAKLLSRDDLCNVYRCSYKSEGKEWQAMFRVARDPDDNDLVQNEARILYHFQTADDFADFRAFLPSVLESFTYQDASATHGRQVNILSLHEHIGSPAELYSLEEVHRAYGSGIHPKDMAWMWRRLLNILGFVHQSGVIHGAVLPLHVLIEPKDHKLALTGWGYAVRNARQTSEHLKAMSMSFETWYPPEVAARQIPTPALDICMAARCMLYLIGADPLGDGSHPTMEPAFQQHFARCLNPNPARRPQGAWELLAEFDRLLEQEWGPREFRVFRMPAKY